MCWNIEICKHFVHELHELTRIPRGYKNPLCLSVFVAINKINL